MTPLQHCMFTCWWLIALMSVDRQTDSKTYRLTDRQTGRETNRKTDRHTDVQIVPFPYPELVCYTIDEPVLLQLDTYCLKLFKDTPPHPSRLFYRTRGPHL